MSTTYAIDNVANGDVGASPRNVVESAKHVVARIGRWFAGNHFAVVEIPSDSNDNFVAIAPEGNPFGVASQSQC